MRGRLPRFPATRSADWRIAEPGGAPIETVRAIRDQIDTRVRALLAELTAAGGDSTPVIEMRQGLIRG